VARAQGKLNESVEALLNLEKMARQGEDITATKATCSAILEVCFEAKQWKLLEENILLLSKRRSQLKQVRSPAAARGAGCAPSRQRPGSGGGGGGSWGRLRPRARPAGHPSLRAASHHVRGPGAGQGGQGVGDQDAADRDRGQGARQGRREAARAPR
jgi:hypothetical protein